MACLLSLIDIEIWTDARGAVCFGDWIAGRAVNASATYGDG
jgi:hypothetical protein